MYFPHKFDDVDFREPTLNEAEDILAGVPGSINKLCAQDIGDRPMSWARRFANHIVNGNFLDNDGNPLVDTSPVSPPEQESPSPESNESGHSPTTSGTEEG